MISQPAATWEARGSEDRTISRLGWATTRFSFPFAGNFELSRYAHGALLVHNDDSVEPGYGFEPHRHQEMEIVTWVVTGALAHGDSTGRAGVLTAGMVQRMSAGTGIRHSERNAAPPALGPGDDRVTRVIQMWLPPDAAGLSPEYREADVNAELKTGKPVVLASGLPRHPGGGAVGIHNRWVALFAQQPRVGGPTSYPAAPFHHVFVVNGEARVEGDGQTADLRAGDALRLTGSGGFTATARAAATELLVWEMHAHF